MTVSVANIVEPDVDLTPVREFLRCSTPASWVEAAARPENLHTLLIDHAN